MYQETQGAFQSAFVVDGATRAPGGQVDWSNVPDDYIVSARGFSTKLILPGTIMARQADGLLVPRKDAAEGLKAAGLLDGTAREHESAGSMTGNALIVGGVIYKNMLPDFADDALPYVDELQAVGTGFAFRLYETNVA